MQGSRLGLIAAFALLAGSAGCALPHALPLEGGTTAGPSPYGVWYEQHWATNSVLLAAADQPEEDVIAPAGDTDSIPGAEAEITSEAEYTPDPNADPIDSDAEAAAREAALAAEAAAVYAPVEASVGETEQFDDSSPYQFPASSFAPATGTGEQAPPPTDAPIRY